MRRPYLGYPLWALLRYMANPGTSRIEQLLSGEAIKGWNFTKHEMAEELLYRFVRRFPKKILACDSSSRFVFMKRYGAPFLNGVPHECCTGFLEAGNKHMEIVSTGGRKHWEYPSPEMVAATDRVRAVIEKKGIRKKFEKMSNEQKVVFVLITQMESLLNGKTRIRRSQNDSTKGYGRTGLTTIGGDVGVAQR